VPLSFFLNCCFRGAGRLFFRHASAALETSSARPLFFPLSSSGMRCARCLFFVARHRRHNCPLSRAPTGPSFGISFQAAVVGSLLHRRNCLFRPALRPNFLSRCHFFSEGKRKFDFFCSSDEVFPLFSFLMGHWFPSCNSPARSGSPPLWNQTTPSFFFSTGLFFPARRGGLFGRCRMEPSLFWGGLVDHFFFLSRSGSCEIIFSTLLPTDRPPLPSVRSLSNRKEKTFFFLKVTVKLSSHDEVQAHPLPLSFLAWRGTVSLSINDVWVSKRYSPPRFFFFHEPTVL